ncbi:potassium channel family protein [Halonatronum saccharophilum]|uniref:potassium channel family protein n=1 Tax=Halonatronum saccharophilum TaxID=150060 RepID=UPI00048021D1|nr:NAD-binding protein [Halonatronum saccharophilum]
MKVVIAGGGANGQKLIELLKGYSDHKLTLIENDSKVCELISEGFPKVNIIWGDATDTKVLEEAEVNKANVFIAMTGNDHINLLSAKAAKKMGVAEVIVKVVKTQHKKLAEVMDLENVVDPVDAISAQLITRLTGIDVAELIHELHLDMELKRCSVDDYPQIEGVKITELAKIINEDVYPILIIRDDKHHLPSNIKKVRKGDVVISWKQKNKDKGNFFNLNI